MQVFRILPLETLSEQRRKSQLCRTCFMTVAAKCINGNNKPLLNKNSLRTIGAQFVPKRKNNEARSKFTGSYKKSVYTVFTFPLFQSCFPPLSCGSYGISLFFSSYFSCVSHVFLPNPEIYFHLRSCTSRPLTIQTEVTVTDAKAYAQSKAQASSQ